MHRPVIGLAKSSSSLTDPRTTQAEIAAPCRSSSAAISGLWVVSSLEFCDGGYARAQAPGAYATQTVDVISPIGTMASAERFNIYDADFSWPGGLLARLGDESGRRVSTTYGWTRRKHSRPLPTAIGFAPGQQCGLRSRSSTSRSV